MSNDWAGDIAHEKIAAQARADEQARRLEENRRNFVRTFNDQIDGVIKQVHDKMLAPVKAYNDAHGEKLVTVSLGHKRVSIEKLKYPAGYLEICTTDNHELVYSVHTGITSMSDRGRQQPGVLQVEIVDGVMKTHEDLDALVRALLEPFLKAL